MSKAPNKTFADLLAKAAIENHPGRKPSDIAERKAFKAGAKWAATLFEDAFISKDEEIHNLKNEIEALQYGEDL